MVGLVEVMRMAVYEVLVQTLREALKPRSCLIAAKQQSDESEKNDDEKRKKTRRKLLRKYPRRWRRTKLKSLCSTQLEQLNQHEAATRSHVHQPTSCSHHRSNRPSDDRELVVEHNEDIVSTQRTILSKRCTCCPRSCSHNEQ